MKKYAFLLLFVLFLPHYLIWATVLFSGFSIDYKGVFNSDGFWAISCMWWLLGGIFAVIPRVEAKSENP